MIYDTSKTFVNNIGRKFISLTGIPSGPVALLPLSDLTILFISSLEAGGKSKARESGKTFSFMVATLGWFL